MRENKYKFLIETNGVKEITEAYYLGDLIDTGYGIDILCEYSADAIIQQLQYTGIKDKNGVEIYEGDILKGKYSNYNNEDKRFLGQVSYITHSFKCVGITKWYGMHIDFNSNFEVIGNIYENPELL